MDPINNFNPGYDGGVLPPKQVPPPPGGMDGNPYQPSPPGGMYGDQNQPPPPGGMHGNPNQPPPPGSIPGNSNLQPPPPGGIQGPPPPGGMHGNLNQPPPPGSMHGHPNQPPPPGGMHGNQNKPPPPGGMHGIPNQPPPPGSIPGNSNQQPPPPGSKQGNYNQAPPGRPSGELSKTVIKSSDDPVASAPALSNIAKVPGYENVSFNAAVSPPPAYEEIEETPISDRGIASNLPTITEDQVREALFQHVSEHCCYGKGPATEMIFKSLESSSAFHYNIETFTERRETAWAYEPFTGQTIDSCANGRAPSAWEISVIPPKSFMKGKAHSEIPHTASVINCHACHAQGFKRCSICIGVGTSICSSCNGSGFVVNTSNDRVGCHSCNGGGRKTCYRCNGQGTIRCCTCEGAGSLKCYICLTITWSVHSDDHVVERTALPSEKVREVSGQVAFEEEKQRIWPVRHFPDVSINKASADLVNQHLTSFPLEKILMQRQMIRIIPVVQVFYQWKNKSGEFYVYGFEQKVHAPDYPQKCCWGCNIL